MLQCTGNIPVIRITVSNNLTCRLSHDSCSLVGRAPIDDDVFKVGVILRENAQNRSFQKAALVQRRCNHRDLRKSVLSHLLEARSRNVLLAV